MFSLVKIFLFFFQTKELRSMHIHVPRKVCILIKLVSTVPYYINRVSTVLIRVSITLDITLTALDQILNPY